MAKRTVDPLKAKQKKQKILAAVLGVVFLGLVAFQGPKVWKQLHPPAPAAASTGTTTTAAPPAGTPTLAAPTLQGTAQPTSGTTSSPDSTTATITMEDGQLASFSRFASKDPFAQQLSDEAKRTSSAAPKGTSSSPGSSTGTVPGSSGKAPAPGSAVISVNGTLYTVAVGTDFPQASSTDPSLVPLFHLVSVTAHTAKISIVGGSYSNGAPTVTLTENKPLTLMNTADRTRYKLILKPAGTNVPTAPTTTTSTSTTVTVPPPAP